MSRYYVAKRPREFLGVCEVPEGRTDIFFQHLQWPELTRVGTAFRAATFTECTDPETGWWTPLWDEDLLMDEGL